MKIKGFALGSALAALFCTSTNAVELKSEKPSSTRRTQLVAELRTQDSAFSLLTETYRQFQNYLIERDYEARLIAAKSIADPKVHRQVIWLAQQERELRDHKLDHQLANLSTTYSYSRASDEREAGQTVPIAVDKKSANDQLRDFVIIAPAATEADSPAPVIPARAVLLDNRPQP
jgi:hypothetical protein